MIRSLVRCRYRANIMPGQFETVEIFFKARFYCAWGFGNQTLGGN